MHLLCSGTVQLQKQQTAAQLRSAANGKQDMTINTTPIDRLTIDRDQTPQPGATLFFTNTPIGNERSSV